MDTLRRYVRDRLFGGRQAGGEGDRGAALVLVLLVAMTLFGIGGLAVAVSVPESRVVTNFQASMQAKNFAESELDRIVGMQNDLTRSPRYLFASTSYQLVTPDSAVFTSGSAIEPATSGSRAIGTITSRVSNTNPILNTPPYTVSATATLNDGSSTTYQATIDAISLLDFAVYSENSVWVGSNITIDGRMYSGRSVTLTGPNAIFLRPVEYVQNLVNAAFGTFRQGNARVPALPSLTALTNMTFFENASKNAGVCTSARGLYIGRDGGAAVDNQSANLFQSTVGRRTNQGVSGCRNSNTCYLLDLTLFDFTANPVTYDGNALIAFNGSPLRDFNGVVFVDGEVHVWGHLGGRSVEDQTITDTYNYNSPPTRAVNLYSNDRLDTNEDGSNGGTANGFLDTRNRGVNLGVYSIDDIFIDHNIFAGADSAGLPVRLALVANSDVRIDSYSPRTIIMETAVLARLASWRPYGTSTSAHRLNEWANNRGSLSPNSYVYDLDGDGTLEVNTGVGQSGDRNETSMRSAWTLRNEGNLVVNTSPNSGVWSANGHPRYYNYDTQLQTAEIPCYPTLPNYGIVLGSFTEVLVTAP
ncbi:MAG: hypothetical protein ACE5HF_00190 [Gemmatimonadota bacterium]